jgi:ribokinase
MPDVLIAGGANMDTTYRVGCIPVAGESVAALGKSQCIGGKGVNQAVAIRRSGMSAAIIGATGPDSQGKAIRAFLDAEAIDISYLVELSNQETGGAIIAVDMNGDNVIIVGMGANAAADASIVDKINGGLNGVRYAIANGEAPFELVKRLFDTARIRQIPTVWNPSPMPQDRKALLKLTDILIVNRTEAIDLVGTGLDGDLDSLIKALAGFGPGEIVVTSGTEGSAIAVNQEIHHIPAPRVITVDPTAAGDTFLGYYVSSRAGGMLPEAAGARASFAAALCVQAEGASVSIPFNDDVARIVG